MIGVLATTLMLAIGIGTTAAHEFIIKPVQMKADPGHTLPFSVISAHAFMISEEMEPADEVDVSLIRGDGNDAVALKPNDVLMTLDGAAELKTEGTHILAGHRNGMIWTQTTRGWKQAGKKGLTGVMSSGKYEKFCKTLVVCGYADAGYKTVVGHKLEIVPMDDPSQAVPGRDLRFQVLYDGKPQPAEVYATYDGFTDAANTYAYYTETDEAGQARVRITHPGVWMVRVQHKVEEPTEDYDSHVLRAVLVFGVN
jgi:uncharacterized GH25 family protein